MSSSGPPSAEPDAGRLQRCIRDLAALDALVSSCVGRSVDETFDFALEALPVTLGCELVLVETPEPHAKRAAIWYGQRLGHERLGELHAAAAAANASSGPLAFGSTPLHWVEMDLPVGRARGRLLVARRALLHGDTDRVLARSAANLVGAALENASVLEAARRKDEFIATLSHEIRNPLAPLRTAISLLRIAGVAEAAHACDIMDRQLDHLVRLVDELLDASRIGRGTLQLRREAVSLDDVMRTAVEASSSCVRDAGHALELVPGPAAWLDGDPVRLVQIFTNLLNNASRFTPRGGKITFSAETREGHVLVSVRDTGEGFAPEVSGRLFEMFAKSHRSPGLGIGLSLSRRLAEMHGGGIEARSEGPGQGAEFVVRLPTTAAPATPAERRAPAAVVRPRIAGEALRVLVADDNTDSAELLSLLFSQLGCEVTVAHDGAEAVRTAQSFRPDLAILDIGMPVLDGYEAARTIRAEAAGRRLTLVAMTGWGQEDDRRRARDAGFDQHLLKPADFEKLAALLDAARAGDPPPVQRISPVAPER
jgi:signal transduction histidine kinase/CheY-like chemotaxis protein